MSDSPLTAIRSETDRTLLEPITKLPLSSLGGCDVAMMNLRAASGLPGTDSLDDDLLLSRLDEWAHRCRFEIWRHLYRIESQISQPPTEYSYGNSLGRFFCWHMLQVLQEDCGVVYHPDRKFNPEFCNPEDIFIHGIVADGGKGGTCASMPVVYVAVGQRLGLPVRLVHTRGHLFFRWDDPKGTLIEWEMPRVQIWIQPERFNVDGSGGGIAYHDDAHYVNWPEKWTDQDRAHGRYLRSMNGQEVLADFLIQRAECLYDLHDWHNCLKSIFFARQLAPDDPRYEWLHALRSRQLKEHEEHMQRIHEMELEKLAEWESLPGTPGHSRACHCGDCERRRELAASLPVVPHKGSCTCTHCRKAAEAESALVSEWGHPQNCGCAGCLHKQSQYSHAVPGLRPPMRIQPGFAPASQSAIHSHNRSRLPGT